MTYMIFYMFYSICVAFKNAGFCTNPLAQNLMQTFCHLSCRNCTGPANFGLFSDATTTDVTTTTTEVVTRGYNGHCGVPLVSLESRPTYQRIIGGRVANYGSHPWLVSIRLTDVHVCGGTLVTQRHVITAAHCFNGDRNPNVARYYGFLGKYHRPINEVDAGQVNVTFSKILVHPLYNNVTFDYDIAIITLSNLVQFSNYVRPACLPRNNSEIPLNKNATIAGWGYTTAGVGLNRLSDTLQQTKVQVIDNDLCNQWLSIHPRRRVTSNMFCAGYEVGKRDACKGDSGGPLVIEESTYQILYGVVSWGKGCAQLRRPGVYTRVPVFVDWILTNLI